MARPVRIPAQPPDEWTDETRAQFDGVAPVPAGTGERKPLHLPAVVARHPSLLAPYLTWAKAVALQGVLPRRENALLALRTALRCRSEFEWGVHAETAITRAGLTRDDVARVGRGPAAPGWSAHDVALLQAVDDLHDTGAVGDATWAALAADHDDAALIEIVFVVGHYTMLSMLANSTGVPAEPHWDPLPPLR